MISINVIWREDSDDWALVGYYRLTTLRSSIDGVYTWYVDHLFPYAGGEGLTRVAVGTHKSRYTARELAERALQLELMRIERE